MQLQKYVFNGKTLKFLGKKFKHFKDFVIGNKSRVIDMKLYDMKWKF